MRIKTEKELIAAGWRIENEREGFYNAYWKDGIPACVVRGMFGKTIRDVKGDRAILDYNGTAIVYYPEMAITKEDSVRAILAKVR